MKHFDLNIEKILENWEPHHAIREIIANALDEQQITNTQEIEIYKEGSSWIIRDYGRGLRYTHLTQNENQEKHTNSNVIGKFGIGLKDALATFDRNDISVLIISKYGNITISKTKKIGFDDIITLHANIEDTSDLNFIGTKYIIKNINDLEIGKAKKLFLKFSGEQVIETTKFGHIINKLESSGNIYINGVKVSDEPNFLFSYNITEKTKAIQKALNRERTNVGRTAYSDSVKKILLNSNSTFVINSLASDLQNYNQGTQHDELNWIDVQEHSVKLLNQNEKVIFVTSNDLIIHRDLIDQAMNSGHQIITIPESLQNKISGIDDSHGNKIIDINQFISIYNNSFEFKFIEIENLTTEEKEIFQYSKLIIDLSGGMPNKVKSIRISETMVKDLFSSSETLGCWDPNTFSIVISRKQLKNISDFSGTLIHELIHARTGFLDVSRDFESELTQIIGKITNKYLLEISTYEMEINPGEFRNFTKPELVDYLVEHFEDEVIQNAIKGLK